MVKSLKGKQTIKSKQAEIKMRGVETKWWRLGDEEKGTEMVLRGLEVILYI